MKAEDGRDYYAGEVEVLKSENRRLRGRINRAWRLVADSLERPDDDGASAIAALEILAAGRRPLKTKRRK